MKAPSGRENKHIHKQTNKHTDNNTGVQKKTFNVHKANLRGNVLCVLFDISSDIIIRVLRQKS